MTHAEDRLIQRFKLKMTPKLKALILNKIFTKDIMSSDVIDKRVTKYKLSIDEINMIVLHDKLINRIVTIYPFGNNDKDYKEVKY